MTEEEFKNCKKGDHVKILVCNEDFLQETTILEKLSQTCILDHNEHKLCSVHYHYSRLELLQKPSPLLTWLSRIDPRV